MWLVIKKYLPKSELNHQVEEINLAEWNNYRKHAKYSFQPNTLEKGINLIGYLQASTGLGEAARSSHTALTTTNLPCELIDFEENIPNNQKVSQAYIQAEPPTFKYRFNLFHINPPQLSSLWNVFSPAQLSSHYNIGVWYWEMPEFPNEWNKYFNLVDEIWVASQFVKESIEKNSQIPVIIIPPCIQVQTQPDLKRADFGLPEEPYLFLCAYDVLSSQQRKNPQGAIDAFKMAFENTNTSVGLVIKINNAIENFSAVAKLKEATRDYPNCYFLEDTYSRHKFNSLISLMDTYISLHRAEGFGLIAAESMYLGKPVIMTRWSGNVDFMTEDNCCGVDYELIKVGPNDSVYDANQQWADPNLEQAAEYMKRLTKEKAYNRVIGKNAKKTMTSQFSPERLGQLILLRIDDIVHI